MSKERYKGIEGVDYIVCLECGRRMQQIDDRHLRVGNHTSMNQRQYQLHHPNAPLICEASKNIRVQQFNENVPVAQRLIQLAITQMLKRAGGDKIDPETQAVRRFHLHLSRQEKVAKATVAIHEEGKLTMDEATQLAQVTEESIRHAIKRGKLSAIKIQNQWAIDPDSLNAYIERHQQRHLR